MLAGHETSATLLTWCSYHLSHNPEVRARLEEAIERGLGDRPPTPENLGNLAYTGAVFEEQDRCESRSGDGSGASGIEVAAVGAESRRDEANPGEFAPDGRLDRPLLPRFGRREADSRAQAATRSIRLAALSRFITVAFNVSSASTLRQVR